MTNKLIILRVQVRLLSWHCNRIGLKEKVIRDGTIQNLKLSMHCKKISQYNDICEKFHFSSIAIYRYIVIFLGNASIVSNSVSSHL